MISEPADILWEDAEHVLARQAGHLVLAPASPQPTPTTISQLERTFALRDQLDESWALRPRELLRRNGRPNLLFDDPGGEILARHVGRPWPIAAALRVAVGLTAALRQLHGRGIVHKDIKPSNLLVDLASGKVWLGGFGQAALTSREPASVEPSGTFAYMAPEQTGRLNRPVDQRSDLYSVGVTLYELLAGALPFTAATPIEWIHSHVARPAPSLTDRVPAQLDAIVSKLLAKTLEDRYQTAAGLEYDLLRCVADLRAYGRIQSHPLGTRDDARQLAITERLYGRGDPIGRLVASFRRVAAGSTELVLISGYSGIGKSALVGELVRSLAGVSVRVARGKFDQYKRDIPYATLAEALQGLVQEILRESEPSVERWRAALQEAIGGNGALIANLVPQFELLVGPQPAVADVSVEEAKHRFQLLVQRVLSVFARAEHPLVLFFDDMQWLDRGTLDLVRYLVDTGARHLMLIGAYRDNEVSTAHPLLRMVDDIRKAGAAVHSIILGALPLEDVSAFVADALHDRVERVASLAHLVHDKTGGNPFFVIQFLLALRDDGLLGFDDATSAWQWDVSRIVARGFTDNLADFMVAKISRLPATTREVLKQFACIGRTASASLLAAVVGQSEEQLEATLHDPVRTGLIAAANGTYAFPHDRVQEASYALTTAGERARVHLRIAEALEALDPTHRDEQLFEIANHFNQGSDALGSSEQRIHVAELDLAASRRAASAIAFESALEYAIAGLAALGDAAWTRAPDLAFALILHRANCEYLTGAVAAAADRLAALAERPTSLPDRCQVTCLRAAIHLTRNQSEEAIGMCLEQLRAFGIDWNAKPSDATIRAEYELLLRRIPDGRLEQLVDLPMMTDPSWRACMDVLLALEPVAVFSDKALHDLGVIRMANLSIEHGLCEASPLGFAELSLVLWPRFGARLMGFQFGELGRALVDQRGLLRSSGRVLNVVGHHVMPWREPPSVALAVMRRALAIATESGDLVFRQYCLVHIPVLGLAAGEPLDDIQRELEVSLAFVRKSGFELIVQCLVGLLVLVEALRGAAPGTPVDETTFLEPAPGLEIAAYWYWIRVMQAKVFEGDFVTAARAADRARTLVWTAPSFFERAEYVFYAALARTGTNDLEAAAALHAELAEWVVDGPALFTSRTALVGAELARLRGQRLEAQLLYEQALEATRVHALTSEEGLVHEIAARFYDGCGLRTSAQAFRSNARACYERWGAFGKVRQLDREHRGLAAAISGVSPIRQLDVATVLEISHAVSREIVHDRLVERLMAIAVEHAGAARGLLVTPTPHGYRLEAEARVEARKVSVTLVQKPLNRDALPESILHYVGRTQQIVNFDDASKPSSFAADEYLARTQARSVLCFPLVRHGELVAVLYLENNLTSHAFTPDRIAVLRVLASQAAISLENARLYDEIKRGEEELRRAELYLSRAQRLSHTGSFGWNIDTGAVFWSDEAFAIYGYDRGITPTAEDMIVRVHPDDQPRIIAQVAEVMRESSDWVSEFRLVMLDGTLKDAHVTASAVRNSKGEREYVGAIMDVTERKRAQQAEALALANDRLERALRGSNVGIWDFDATAGSLEQAPMYSVNLWESLGYAHEAAEAEAHPERWYPGDRERLLAAASAVLAGVTRELDIESRMLDKHGATRWRLQRGVAERNTERGTARLIGTSVDITDRKHLEEQLRTAKEDAEAASKAKDDFLANVSHEIRTPMNAVLGMTELVLETDVTAEQRQWLQTVKSAADNLLVIIDDLLDFSKIEAGMLELHVTTFGLRSELDDTLRALAFRTVRKGLRLTHRISEAVPERLVGDIGRLRQVLINLVGNAIKFTPAGSIDIEVILTADRGDDVELSFSVRDTGIGIPHDKQAVIFQAFTQQDTSTTRTYGGTGLGLTIAARLAALMSGRIGVVSKPGVGSTFTFAATFGRAQLAHDLATPHQAHAALPRASLRVLVAEDHEFNAMLLKELLTRRGHRPDVATNGHEVLERFAREPYDVLLLDLHMPGLDGFEVIRAIREHEQTTGEHLPVIALTARSRREDRERCLAAGMDDFVSKPIQVAALTAAIERLTRAQTEPTLVTPSALLAACDGDPGTFGRIVTALRAATPHELHLAERCFVAQDLAGVREAAHRLHGIIGAVSTTVGDVASELEDLATESTLEAVRPVLARLTELVHQLLGELERTTFPLIQAASQKPI